MARYLIRKESLCFDPNSSKPYKLSRTRIDNFFKCPHCFWLEERRGIKKPDSYPLTLNIAVDALLKKEFDTHRLKQIPHPIMVSNGIEAIPFQHEHMDQWRHNFTGIQTLHEKTNLLIFGAVDDVWVSPNDELYVVDYKATSKVDTPTLQGDLGAQYKRQMEVYQWLLRQNGFQVSNTGYFVYVNGKKDADAFDAKLEFDITVLPCVGDSTWIEPTLFSIKECLMQDFPPPETEQCDLCGYRGAVQTVLANGPQTLRSTIKPEKKAIKKTSVSLKKDETQKLF